MKPPGSETNEWLRFQTTVAVVIALVSALGAYLAWLATVTSTEAIARDREVIQQRIESEAKRLELTERLYRQVGLFARYQEHVVASGLLAGDVKKARLKKDSIIAQSLDIEAQAELALARSLTPFFKIPDPDFSDIRKAELNWGTQLNNLRRIEQSNLTDPDVERARMLASNTHDKAGRLVHAEAVKITSLLALTLAYLGPVPIRWPALITGTLIVLWSLWGVWHGGLL